jgi:hypothetical protein
MTFHRSLMAAAVLAIAAAPAFALTTTTVTIDFDAVPSNTSILDSYLTTLGVSFSGEALALQANDFPGVYSNAPTPTGIMYVNGSDIPNPNIGEAVSVLSPKAGNAFVNEVSFWFSSAVARVPLVEVYSGANGTGTLLADSAIGRRANAQTGCSDAMYCNWQRNSISFSGQALSVVFYANLDTNGNQTAFDNVTVSSVPEPSSYAMLAGGLMALGFMARRRRQG